MPRTPHTHTHIYIRPLDNRYGFCISVQPEIDCTISHFLCLEKKMFFLNFQKLTGLWLAGAVVNHVGIYGSKVAEGLSAFQRRSCFVKSQISLLDGISSCSSNEVDDRPGGCSTQLEHQPGSYPAPVRGRAAEGARQAGQPETGDAHG